MEPKPTMPSAGDLYRSHLDQILDPRHELFRLTALIDWDKFDQEFERELRRRSAIEPMISHMKADGRLGRNYLLGATGDAINALLLATGHNLRLILNWLKLFVAWLMAGLMSSPAQPDTSRAA